MKIKGLPHVNLDKLNKLVALSVAIAFMLQLFMPLTVFAAAGTLTSRKITLGSSAISGTDREHKYDFTLSGTDNLGSIKFEYCTAASGACGTVTGLDTDAATIDAQTGATGFTVYATTTTTTVIGITLTAASASGAVSYTFSGIINPSTTNQTFFIRITTYTAANFTCTDDTGVVAASTANQIDVSALVDETLTFCVYTGANCAAGGSTVNLGTLSASSHAASNFGTSKMDAATNANSGYAIAYAAANTLTGPNGTITANAGSTQVAGTEEFGINLKNNTDPDVGIDPVGGSGSASAGYGTADSFKFNTSGEQVASASAATVSTTYNVSYVADISTITEPGTYQTTVVYIA